MIETFHPVKKLTSSKAQSSFRWLRGKESACQHRRCKRHGFDPWVGKILWRRKRQSAPVFLLRKSHGHRRLMGYSPIRVAKELDMTEWLSTHKAQWLPRGLELKADVLIPSPMLPLLPCCLLVRKPLRDLPGGPVVKNLPASARHGFYPWSGKIPHAPEWLSLRNVTIEPVL